MSSCPKCKGPTVEYIPLMGPAEQICADEGACAPRSVGEMLDLMAVPRIFVDSAGERSRGPALYYWRFNALSKEHKVKRLTDWLQQGLINAGEYDICMNNL